MCRASFSLLKFQQLCRKLLYARLWENSRKGTPGFVVYGMKRIWNHLNIAAKLIVVFSLVSVIPLVVSSFVLYHVAASSLEKAMEETTSALNSQIVSDMNDFIKDYDSLTKSLLVDDTLISNLSEDLPISERIDNKLYYRHLVMELMALKSDIQSVCIMNLEGQYYHYDRNGKVLNYDSLTEQEWFKDELSGTDTIFLTPIHDCSYYDRNQDQISITFGRRIYKAGRVAGMVLIDMSPASLIRLSEEFLMERTQYNIKINITDADGGLIYDSDLSSGRVNYSQIDKETLLLYQKNTEDFLIMRNETELLGMKVNTVIPKSTMLLRVSYIQKVTVLLVTVLLLVIIVTSILFSRKMVGVIRRLQAGMKRLEAGKYEFIDTPAGNDEIGSLVKSYNHMVSKMQALLEEVYISGVKQKNAQLMALRTQINPHFLFNTLESIRIKAILDGDDPVADMIKMLAKMFRTTLDSNESNHRVIDELENIRSFVRLQNLRFNNIITLEDNIEPEICQAKMIAIVFQPVVENCFKHGSRGRNVPLRISIEGRRENRDSMIFMICDNGKGMTKERLTEINRKLAVDYTTGMEEEVSTSRSIGLRNIAERIRLRYGNEGSLRIVSSDESGTVIEIRLPYLEQGENNEV